MHTLHTQPLHVTVGEARSALREALNASGIAIFSEMDQTREAFNDLLTIPASALCAWIILKGMAALGLA